MRFRDGNDGKAHGVKRAQAVPMAYKRPGSTAGHRGRRRMEIALVGVTIWRMQSLDGLPDIGDPFDVAEARRPVEIPDADNAFVAYAAAKAKLGNRPNPIDDARLTLLWDAVWNNEIKALTWASVAPGLREYVEAKRSHLGDLARGKWASRCPLCSTRPHENQHAVELDPGYDPLRRGRRPWRARVSRMPARRMKPGTGTMRSCDRAGSSAGTGGSVNAYPARGSTPWPSAASSDGWPILRVGATQLRRALHDTLIADALTPPVSEAIKIDSSVGPGAGGEHDELRGDDAFHRPTYPSVRGPVLGLLDWFVPWGAARLSVQRMRLGASNELERTRRAFRLLFANWL